MRIMVFARSSDPILKTGLNRYEFHDRRDRGDCQPGGRLPFRGRTPDAGEGLADDRETPTQGFERLLRHDALESFQHRGTTVVPGSYEEDPGMGARLKAPEIAEVEIEGD